MDYIISIIAFGGIFGLLSLFFCLIWEFKGKRALFICLFSAYIGALISLTFFHGVLPERSYNLIPLITAFTSKAKFYHIPQMLVNLAMFVPFGVFLNILNDDIKRNILTGLLLSFVIESFQLLLMRGVFDVDDLILNTLGTMIGHIITSKIKRKIVNEKL